MVIKNKEKEEMNLVFVGHVDHGKSTILGKLLAETDSLPKGKLKQVKDFCEKNSKPFEYAYLLDALKDEQKQGITIDSALCYFQSKKRNYTIIDAPGHIEFLKNMISGAAKAEAAVLVIDAQEGIKENSKRHGYMLSMLGIDQVLVAVNKMDLVDYKEERFNQIKEEYTKFLEKIGIEPNEFVPISGFEGDNILEKQNLDWFKGHTFLEALDSFKKSKPPVQKPFRMPVQDVYKFSEQGDERRIVAGKIEAGKIEEGEEVIFLPSNKMSKIESIEEFNSKNPKEARVGQSAGFTLEKQIYINRGEVMCRDNGSLPKVGPNLKTKIFWMDKKTKQKNKEYKLKLTTTEVPVKIKKINSVLNASNLEKEKKEHIDRHEVADCFLECQSPIAFDLFKEIESTGRFVIVDEYNISGGGIITGKVEDKQEEARKQVYKREKKWYPSLISSEERALRYNQKPKLILLTGPSEIEKKDTAKKLEKKLFNSGKKVYYLGIGNLLRGLDSDIDKEKREEHIRRLGEVSHLMMDAGLLVVASASDLSNQELRLLQTITTKEGMLIINEGEDKIDKNLVDLELDPDHKEEEKVDRILDLLKFKEIIFTL